MGKKQLHFMYYPLLALCITVAISCMVVDSGEHFDTSAASDQRGDVAVGRHLERHSGHHRTAKLSAPITLTAEVPAPIGVGETVTVVLGLRSAHRAGRMEVSANFPDGLAVLGVPSAVFYYSNAVSEHRWELSISALKAGNLRFGVVAQEYDASGNAQLFKGFSVPVAVGDPVANAAAFKAQQASSPYLRTDASGRRLIEMPASEPPPQ